MKEILYLIVFLAVFSACQKKQGAITTETIGDNVVTTVNLTYPMDSVAMQLSSLGENFRVVPLETNDSCLFGKCFYMVGKKYIVAFARTQILLFDANGKYLRTLAVQGRGAGEFMSIRPSSQTMNQSEDQLVASDFSYEIVHRWSLPDGEYSKVPTVDKTLPYSMRFVNDSVLQLANHRDHLFSNHYVYTQTLSGTLLNGISNKRKMRFDAASASPERLLFLLGDGQEFYHPVSSDTIYQILPDTLMLKYCFPLPEGTGGEIMYVGQKRMLARTRKWLQTLESVSENGIRSTRNVFDVCCYVVDIPGEEVFCFRNLQDDYLGVDNIVENIVFQDNNIFYIQYSPTELMKMIPKILEKKDLDIQVRQRVEKLNAEITEDSNPVLIIGECRPEYRQ